MYARRVVRACAGPEEEAGMAELIATFISAQIRDAAIFIVWVVEKVADHPPEWITALATIFIAVVATVQLQALRHISNADFIHRLNNDFYTAESRRVRKLLEATDLRLETFGKRARFIVGRQSLDDHEIDDLVLGPLEAVGIFFANGVVDLESAYEMFGTCVIEVWENAVVKKYIGWQRELQHGADIYDKLETLYGECTAFEMRKNSAAFRTQNSAPNMTR